MKILAALNVKEDEEAQVLLMLSMGFFMGIFVATYQVTAESLFLNQLGDQLDKAFLISGVLGIGSTALFSLLQNRIKFTNLAISSILVVVFFTSAVFGLYRFGPKEYHNEILFFMYCITGPMTALLLLCYWGIFGRLFDFRQSKRIIGWIDTGQLVATILAFLLIPLTLSYFVDTENYLIVCCFSILGSLLSLIFISVRYKLTKNDPVEFEADVKQQTSLTSIFKDKYTVLLSV